MSFNLGISWPKGNFNLDFAGASGWPTTINYSTQFYGGGFGVPYSCNGAQASAGVYYSVGEGLNTNGGGYSYNRIPGFGGPFGWTQTPVMGASAGMDPAIGQAAAPFGRLISDVYGSGFDPYNRGHVRQFLNEREGAQRRYDEIQKERAEAAERKDRSDAPERLADRAEKYFDSIVKKEQDPSMIFTAASQRRIIEDEKEDAKGDERVKGREEALKGLVGKIRKWNEDNARANRGHFKARAEELQKSGDTDKMLIALMSPAARDEKHLGSVFSREDLGGYMPTSNNPSSKELFAQYKKMLHHRFGNDYDSVIKKLFNKTVSYVEGKPREDVKEVTVKDIKDKDYMDKEAEVIYDKVFKGKTALEQAELLESLPSVESDNRDITGKVSYDVGRWYLRKIKKWTDDTKIKNVPNEQGKKLKWDLGKLLDKLSDADEAKSKGDDKADKPKTARPPRGKKRKAPAVPPAKEDPAKEAARLAKEAREAAAKAKKPEQK